MIKSKFKSTFNSLFEIAVYLKRILSYRIIEKPFPFPMFFQIQTNNLCNGSCVMCPISKEKNKKPGMMSDELFEKIIKEISENKSKFTYVWLYLQNEPLTDKNIFKKVKQLKELSRGKISVGIVTNGTLLTNDKIEEICESDIDRIHFSIDAFTEETYKKIRRGLSYTAILKNIEGIRNSNCKVRVTVGFTIQKDNYFELDDFKKFWKRKGIGIELNVVNNRSGDLSDFENIRVLSKDIPFRQRFIHNFNLRMSKGCVMLATVFNILYNGDVIMCCNDYTKKLILGNVNNESIKEIWNSKKYQFVRKSVSKKDFEKVPACKNCTKLKPM